MLGIKLASHGREVHVLKPLRHLPSPQFLSFLFRCVPVSLCVCHVCVTLMTLRMFVCVFMSVTVEYKHKVHVQIRG